MTPEKTIKKIINKYNYHGLCVSDIGHGKYEVVTINSRIPEPIIDFINANYHVIGKVNNQIIFLG